MRAKRYHQNEQNQIDLKKNVRNSKFKKKIKLAKYKLNQIIFLPWRELNKKKYSRKCSDLMISTLSTLRRYATRMIRRINENSKHIYSILVKYISNIQWMPSEHPFGKILFVTIQIDICWIINCSEVEIYMLICCLHIRERYKNYWDCKANLKKMKNQNQLHSIFIKMIILLI